MAEDLRPTLLVLASTYPRWQGDPEPGFVHELCKRLVGRYRVIAVVPDAPGADQNGDLDGVEVIRFRYAPRAWQSLVNNGGIAGNLRQHPWKWFLVPCFVIGQLLAAWRLLRRQNVSLIHAHWLIPQGVVAMLLGRLFRVPYVVTSHGGDLFGFKGKMLTRVKQIVSAHSAAMSVVSTAMLHEMHRLQLTPPSVEVLPMGVDMQHRFTPGRVTRSSNELLFVGRLVEKKGLPFLFHALPVVLAKRADVRLRIAGFGPERPMLEALAVELRIEHSIEFIGAIEQASLPALYRQATVLVLPFITAQSGDQEGLPVVLMEAIGCGCDVLAGYVPGLDDLLGADASHICVDPRDRDAFAAAILAKLDHAQDSAYAKQALRERVQAHVDWAVVTSSYLKLLGRC